MKKIFKKIHIWLSIPVGIIVSLICFTGAILVFESEITELCNPSRYFVKDAKNKTLTINELVPIVSEQLPDTASISSIQLTNESDRTYRIGLVGSRTSVYVNPYTGKVIEQYNSQKSFFPQTRQLHRWLLFQGESRMTGKMIVGIATIFFVIILITGIIVWIPKNKKQLKKRLKIRVRSGWRKFWYDLHLAGGTYSLILLLVLSLTGLTWSFEWYRNGFYGIFGVELPKSSGGGHHRGSSTKEVKTIDFSKWQDVVTKIQEKGQDYKNITIQDGSATASMNSSYGNSRALDRYTFDAETGDIKEFKPYAEQEKAGKLKGWIYSVHVGSWGGFITKLITFIAATFGGILPISGYYLYIKRKFKKNKKKKKRIMA